MRARHIARTCGGFCVAAILLLYTPDASAQADMRNQCATCHASLSDEKLSAPPKATAGDVHDKAGVQCAGCHGGNASATGKAAAHDSAHGFRGKPSGATICATCHVLLDEKFKTSAHAQIFERACVECHSNHGVKKPGDALLGTTSETVCASCHSEKDDPGFVAAARMRGSIDKLREGIDANTRAIARIKNSGMEVGDQELALHEAGTTLILARAEIHAFNPESLDGVVNDGMKVVGAVHEGGSRALAELAYRRRGLFVSLVAILLFVLALGLKIRQVNQQHPH
jgi:predicted CXXCH cytochrome family protein